MSIVHVCQSAPVSNSEDDRQTRFQLKKHLVPLLNFFHCC
jgi:hypothetical protein